MRSLLSQWAFGVAIVFTQLCASNGSAGGTGLHFPRTARTPRRRTSARDSES